MCPASLNNKPLQQASTMDSALAAAFAASSCLQRPKNLSQNPGPPLPLINSTS